jgi:hypothetical protein
MIDPAGAALAMVEEAFRDVPRPRNEELLHADCFDESELVPLYAFGSWRGMTDADVVSNYTATSFLSAAGFRCFVPAYLSYALRNRQSAEACVSATIWHLDPALYDEKIAAFTRSKFALFNGAQRAAVIAFLEAMLASDYADDAEHALKSWR